MFQTINYSIGIRRCRQKRVELRLVQTSQAPSSAKQILGTSLSLILLSFHSSAVAPPRASLPRSYQINHSLLQSPTFSFVDSKMHAKKLKNMGQKPKTTRSNVTQPRGAERQTLRGNLGTWSGEAPSAFHHHTFPRPFKWMASHSLSNLNTFAEMQSASQETFAVRVRIMVGVYHHRQDTDTSVQVDKRFAVSNNG